MKEYFQRVGKIPEVKDLLNKFSRGMRNEDHHLSIKYEGIPSGPIIRKRVKKLSSILQSSVIQQKLRKVVSNIPSNLWFISLLF